MSKEDLDLQITLENQYTAKIKQTHPDLRFMVSVHLMEHQKIELDLLGSLVPIRNENDSVLSQIKQVDLVSEDKIDLKVISNLIQVPENKLKSVEITFPKKFETLKTFDEQSKFPLWAWIIIFAFLGIASVILLMGVFRIKSSIGNLIDPIAKGFQNLSETDHRNQEPVIQEMKSSFNGFQENQNKKFTPEQLKAFFSECYWTEHDAEASALMRAYSEVSVYQELRFGAQYLDYLKQVKPGSLDFMSDAYFLNPKSAFFELSVSDTPDEMAPNCSQFRFDAKNLSALQLIQIQQLEVKPKELNVKQSSLRTLKQEMRIRFKSVEEEESVLASDQITHEIKLKLPSLFRLNALTKEEFDLVIDKLSVSELAHAWIGPSALLAEIEARLPERKLVLLKNVLQKQTPSRDHASFSRVMELCDEFQSEVHLEKKAA